MQVETKGNVEPVLLLPESDHLLEHLEFTACIILSQNNKISELRNKSDILTPPAVPFP